jgi:homocysteine S-methyltransferase
MKKDQPQSFQNRFDSVPGKNPLILDGSMGSYLHRLGYTPHPHLWFSHLNIEDPEIITKVHSDYINAGADIITTNTFRTNPAAVSKVSSYSARELVDASFNNANTAARMKAVLVAGSNPPAEDSYQSKRTLSFKQLQKNHYEHLELLAGHECSFILNETQSHFDEIKIICDFCYKNNILYVISIFFDENFRILSGESVFEVISYIKNFNPLAISFNCISIPLFRKFLESEIDYTWGFYLNYGLGNLTDKKIEKVLEPGSEIDVLNLALKKNLSFVGACCGSDPGHIKTLTELLYGNNNT